MKLGWRGALGLVLSAALLVWTLRGVDAAGVSAALAAADPVLLLASAAAATAIFPLRAVRWRIILEPIAPGLPFGPRWRATAIGMMVNNVLPARAGEVARAYALTREVPQVPFSAAFASMAVDRTFDAMVLLLLLCVAVVDPAFPGGTRVAGQPIANWAGGAAVVLAGVLAALYAVALFPARILGVYQLLTQRLPPRVADRGRDALLAFAAGLGALRSPRRFAAVLWWTTLHWLLNAFAFWLAFRAVAMDVPASAALFLQSVIAFGVALPSSPGFFGVFEAAAKVGLAVYGVGDTLAVTWAIGFHLLSFIPITVIGGYYFSRLGLRLGEVQAAVPRADAGS
ncbi:MAG TPA: lysylphosphatidylglycerol synthase transmembrane domain-containing protein [Gemmatimonadaceae bacterium]|nr:lysylphosphatidylglycerol synthase transmembrane domain-containing protein [Gemmatimonadaceae bacterium]